MTETAFFRLPARWFNAILLLVVAAGLGIRLYDLTDLPLDFHPTRQLFSAVKARGMYYEMVPDLPADKRQMAVLQWKKEAVIEPEVLERLTAWSYRLFGEQLWIARLYSILFWLAGGMLLYDLARRMTSAEGGLIAILFYLFLPYAVIASRSFQPDPLMVALILAALWAYHHWLAQPSWRWAAAAGLLAGLSIYVKNVAVFLLFFAFAFPLAARGLRAVVRDRQAWLIAFLSVLPAAAYTLYGVLIAGFLGQQFALRFFPEMWIDPAFYLRWGNMVAGVTGVGALTLALVGVFLAEAGRERSLLLGLWGGYFIFGMVFAYHFSTHDYYQLPLIPIVALSLAPVARAIFDQLARASPGLLPRLAVSGVLLTAVVSHMWGARVQLARDDLRSEGEFWTRLGEKLGDAGGVVGMVQDYGYPLEYWGWQNVTPWYTTGDLRLRDLAGRDVDLVQRFEERVVGNRFFVVTLFRELENQLEIKDLLYSRYAIYDQGPDYIIFDLQQPLAVP